MYKLVGINRKAKWNFTDPQTKEKREGYNQRLYVIDLNQMSGDDQEGCRTDTIKCPIGLDTSSLKVGDNYDIFFNKFGTVQDIYKVKS